MVQEFFEYTQGREYRKHYIPRGKSKQGPLYEREHRHTDNVPESRAQIVKFLKDQRRELQNFIDETTEVATNSYGAVGVEEFVMNSGEDGDEPASRKEESDRELCLSDEEEMEDWEL